MPDSIITDLGFLPAPDPESPVRVIDPRGLTILRTYGGELATKKWTWDSVKSEWKVQSYGKARHFYAREPTEIQGIDEIAQLIIQEANSFRMIVRGALSDAAWAKHEADPAHPIQRRKLIRDGIEPDLIEVPRQWMMWDCDDFPLRASDDLVDDPEAAIAHAIAECLPPCFQDVRCFWQLSASAGIKPGVLKVHVWFWLSEPLLDSVLKKTLKQHAPGIADLAVYDPIQAHYIAAPIIEGAPDPIPRRHGMLDGSADEVVLPPLTEEKRSSRRAKQDQTGSMGGTKADALERMGDGEGLDGFHVPLRDAAMHYAGRVRRGVMGRDDDAFIAGCLDAIAGAPRKPGRDMSDYSAERLNRLLDGAYEWLDRKAAEEGDTPPPPGKRPPVPTINCQGGEIFAMVRAAEAALAGAKHLPIYQRGTLVQPVEQEYRDAAGNVTHSAGFAPMTAPALMLLLAQAANFVKWDARLNGGEGDYKRIDPPDNLVQAVLYDRVGWPFETVRGVLTAPTLRPDGSLLLEPGYDAASRYYLMFPSNLVLPEIPDKPTKEEATASLTRLLALVEKYPFVDAPSKAVTPPGEAVASPSRAVALAILMTQVLRCAMPVSPLLAVSAKAPGTGKTHLVDLASTIAIGRTCPSMGDGEDKKEFEKEVNTMLLSGVPGFSIDNVTRDVDSALLNRATSQTHLTIRVYGRLVSVEVENAAVIYETGNNLPIINEQRRRTVRCEMDAKVENPERRKFEVDPIATVLADRGRYVADILTIARGFHVSGAKVAKYPMNGFAAWSHFVREPLIWLGQGDACDTIDMTAKDDPATVRLRAMVEGWAEEFPGEALTAAQAVRKATSDGFYQTLQEQFPAKGAAAVDTTRMGIWLRKFAGRVVNKKCFVRDDGVTDGAARWKVEDV